MNEESIFFRAIECASPEEREIFLEEVCGDDAEKKERIDSLLRFHESVDGDDILVATQHAAEQASRDLTSCSLDFLGSSQWLATGGKIDHYELLQVVGIGATSVVLEAFDTRLERIVAIKVLASESCRDPRTRERFKHEAKTAARISHPNVTQVLGVGEEDRAPYLVMEFVNGQSLQQRVEKEGALPVADVIHIALHIAKGLGAVHQHNLVHRDIKPSNIILAGDGVKITDFGVARCDDHLGLTRTGEVPGTPEFMSPEQAQGLPVDERSDLFSLGSVMYMMATGKSPFEAATPLTAMRRVCDDAPEAIRELNPEVPMWLAAVVDRLLEKRADDRIATADALVRLIHGQVSPPPRNIRQRALKRTTTYTLYLGILIAVCLVFCYYGPPNPIYPILVGAGYTSVYVEDPTIEVTISDGQFTLTQMGSVFACLLKPGPVHVTARKEGQKIDQQIVQLPPRSYIEVVVDNPEAEDRVPEVRSRDPNRDAAMLLLSLGGRLRLVSEEEGRIEPMIDAVKQLPQSAFQIELAHIQYGAPQDLRPISAALSKCERLETLIIERSTLNAEAFIHLARLKQLRELKLIASSREIEQRLPSNHVYRLKYALPNCNISNSALREHTVK